MKPFNFFLALFVTLPAFHPLQGEEGKAIETADLKHPVQPALWKVEGRNLTKPSYLFGTIHLGDPRITTLHPKAEKAFESADDLYTEIDLDPAKALAAAGMMMRKDGTTLSSSIGPELTKKLDTALKAINPALSSQPFETMGTWVMATQLPVLELQMRGNNALDSVLYQRAKKAGKILKALETIESQLKIFNDLKEKEQILLLKTTLEKIAEDKKRGKNPTQKLIDLYLTGEISELAIFMKELMAEMNSAGEVEKELGQRLTKQLLDDRNLKMAKKMAAALAKEPGQTHFFAVGVAHYTGKTAIQDLLKKEGFTITPLFN